MFVELRAELAVWVWLLRDRGCSLWFSGKPSCHETQLCSSDYCLTVDQMPKILVWCFRFCTECVLTFPLKQLRVQDEGFVSNLTKIECFTLTMNMWAFSSGQILMDWNTDVCLPSGASVKAPTHCAIPASDRWDQDQQHEPRAQTEYLISNIWNRWNFPELFVDSSSGWTCLSVMSEQCFESVPPCVGSFSPVVVTTLHRLFSTNQTLLHFTVRGFWVSVTVQHVHTLNAVYLLLLVFSFCSGAV